MRVFVIAALMGLTLGGCAYVGEPLPPALNVPRPVQSLVVEQVGEQLLLHFALPSETTEALPVAIGAIELRAGAVDPGAWPGAATALNVVRDGAAASGSTPAAPWVGRRITAGVRVRSRQGKWSEWSALAPVEVVEPLAAPADVTVEAVPEGVRLRWRATRRSGVSIGIERRSANGRFVQAGTAAEGSEWVDQQARFGEGQQYQLAALTGSGARSETITTPPFTPQDKFAPAAPASLAAVAGLGSIELNWDRPADADLAGFIVYRAPATGGEWTRLGATLVLAASFSDRAIRPGATYRYAVSSVDQNGNESVRSETTSITAPN